MSSSKTLVLLLSALLLTCEDREQLPPETRSAAEAERFFLSSTEGATISRSTLRLLASGFGQPAIAELLAYDVKRFVINYKTTYRGVPVEASGVVTVPLGLKAEAPMVSLQHGTLFDEGEAPSLQEGFQGVEFLASAGYISIMPDYIGYGASETVFHPYYDRPHAASTVVDFIRAVQEFLTDEGVLFNTKLFLAGYSEGGYVTLAAARAIEENPDYGLQLSAVAAGAGGYDLPHMLSTITSARTYSYPAYLAFVLMSYNNTYEWNKPLDYFFHAPYAEALEKFMGGDHGGSYINAKLTSDLSALFAPGFYANLKAGTVDDELRLALQANTVSGWKTSTPIRLYHGTADEIIPYSNSEETLKTFQSAGSPHVTLTPLEGKRHGSGFEFMLRDFIPWFLSM